jgi:hypothetical protein
MKILRASSHAENGTIQLRLNGRAIDTSVGVYEEEIDCGQHSVEWEVDGKPNSSFGITVSSPVAAEYQLVRRLNATGKDSGGYQFSI